MSDREFEQFRDDLESAERKVAGEIDPGVRAVFVAVLVLLLGVSLALPHCGDAKGFDVLTSDPAARAESIALPSMLFVWFAVVFGLLFSMLALVTRRWALAWVAVAGCAVGSVFGVFAIWTRQTLPAGKPGHGPAAGLVFGVILMILLTFHWIRVVWSRTAVQLAAEEQRRAATAEAERRDRDWRER